MATLTKAQLTCSVCQSLFRSPKLLPCLHTFCEECLERRSQELGKGAKLNCPTCHSQHDNPTNGFLSHLLASNNLELLSLNTAKCQNEIDNNPAATKCLDCDSYLCEECTAIHRRHKVSRRHKLATLAELKEGGMKQLEQKRYCADHEGEELKLYCRTCQEVICRDCTIVTHKQHDYTFIKDVREELTKKMESLMTNLERKEAEYQNLLDNIHQASKKEEHKVKEQQARMRIFIDNNIEELKRKKAALFSQISQASSSFEEQLKKKEKTLQSSHDQITSAVTLSQQLVSSASSTDLAMMSKQVIQQLETLQRTYPPVNAARDSLWSVQLSKHDPSKSKVSRPELAVLLYDFEAKNDKQVSCRADELVTVLGTVENGWLEVEKSDGRVGLIPKNYTKQ